MKGKEKDKKTGFPDFLKYRGNNLSGKEKNSFERELQKDPFAAEAEEGFSNVDPSALRNDIRELKSRLGSRTRTDRRIVFYRIAASVAVLMGITTVILLVQNKRPEEIALTGEKKEIIFDIQKPEAINKKNGPVTSLAQNQEVRSTEVSQAKSDKVFTGAGAGKMKAAEIVVKDSAEVRTDEIITAAAEQEKAEAVSREISVPVAAMAAEDRSRKSVADINKTFDHTAAEPVNGIKAFNRYIDKNIIRPDTVAIGELVVELSFIVRLNGVPDSIKVVTTPGKKFSDEAIRLLRDGPKWKPATEFGVNTEDVVIVRIVFK
jgi:hypothetical protein